MSETPLTVWDSGEGARFCVSVDQNRPVALDGLVPGDRVRLKRTDSAEQNPSVEIVTPSPLRRAVVCPAAADCGGCHWLAIAPSAQLQIRRARLEAVAAQHHLSWDPSALELIASPQHLGYRARVRLQVNAAASPRRVGFHGLGSWPVVDLAACPLMTPTVLRTFVEVRAWLQSQPHEKVRDITGFELTALEGSPGALLYLNPRDRAPQHWPEIGASLLTRATIAGVAVRLATGQPGVDLLGLRAVAGHAPAGLPVASAARGFVQANLGCAERLARRLVTWLDAARGPRVLELFSGTTLFGWTLADAGAEVDAVERDPLAVEASALLPPPQSGRMRHHCGNALQFPIDRDYDVLLLDPPRSGLGIAADRWSAGNFESICLISCLTRSFVRDAARLVAAGYRIVRIALADFHPQTQHVEIAALFRR
jgi:23S rRNA (uracil1939-C5)-methyltransferase